MRVEEMISTIDTTPVRPFSNGTEEMRWAAKNCDECARYENKSKSIYEAGCSLSYCLEKGAVSDGTIPMWVVSLIGIIHRQEQYVSLCDQCKFWINSNKRGVMLQGQGEKSI